MPTFRRRGRIDRSRLSQSRSDRPSSDWADDVGDGVDYEVEELHPQKPRLRSKGIYLLPNAFTTAALFCGFFAIVNAMNHQFEVAAIAIFASLVLDGMDGRIARMTNTQSAFGEQYD
ncbi:MAG: CDP-alcohol phosphatidyltransferase family protein, partial [Betaproteobacteria bacterium]|nr:CDP-alcohol phosphatidyltransferase family protein [Betaproteobacteria bacterium]